MNKTCSIIIFLLFVIFIRPSISFSQKEYAKPSVKDTTPIEYLDYRLTKQQFMDYYGIDDTARAVINMFYRKRGSAGITYCVIPGASCIVGGTMVGLSASALEFAIIGTVFQFANLSSSALSGFVILGLLGGVIAVSGELVEPIIATVRRGTYTRQKLLYALVGRERGHSLPDDILEKLTPSDF